MPGFQKFGNTGRGQQHNDMDRPRPRSGTKTRAVYDSVHRTKSDEGYVGAISKPSLRPVEIINTNASSTGNPLVTTTKMANPGDKQYSLDGGGYWGGCSGGQHVGTARNEWDALRGKSKRGMLARAGRNRR